MLYFVLLCATNSFCIKITYWTRSGWSFTSVYFNWQKNPTFNSFSFSVNNHSVAWKLVLQNVFQQLCSNPNYCIATSSNHPKHDYKSPVSISRQTLLFHQKVKVSVLHCSYLLIYGKPRVLRLYENTIYGFPLSKVLPFQLPPLFVFLSWQHFFKLH